MNRNRFNLAQLTPARLWDALTRRVKDLPHSFMWTVSAEGERNRQLLETYRNCHAAQRCFIMGNGPSLARMDLSPLKHEITFGLNRIYLLFDKLPFEPSYYVCINELVLDQYHLEISRLKMPKFLNWNKRSLFESNDSTLFLRLSLGLSDNFSANPGKLLWSGGTVTYAALQLAFYMGFTEVVLIGVDHRFSSTGIPNKTEVRVDKKDNDHFHPHYFPQGTKWQLPDLVRSEIAYTTADKFFRAHGRRIYDATLNGGCNVFEKKDFSSLFK